MFCEAQHAAGSISAVRYDALHLQELQLQLFTSTANQTALTDYRDCQRTIVCCAVTKKVDSHLVCRLIMERFLHKNAMLSHCAM